MSLKIFISYSHQDEELKDQFLEHLSSLKNSGKISEWNDRKITPGDKWKNEIDENLKDSDIVVFLISSAFMSSNYCVNIEAKTAIEMHSEEQAVLIPVVVRAADWEDSELSKFQALPKDAKPISSWEVRDQCHKVKQFFLKYHIIIRPSGTQKDRILATKHTSLDTAYSTLAENCTKINQSA